MLALLSLLGFAGCVITAEYQPLPGTQDDNFGFSAFQIKYAYWGAYISGRGALDSPLIESRTPGAGDTFVKSDADPSVLNFGTTYPLAKAYSDPATEPRERPGWMLHGCAGIGWARRSVFEKYVTPAGESYWIKAKNPEDELNFNFGLLVYIGHIAVTVSYDTVLEAASFGVGYAF